MSITTSTEYTSFPKLCSQIVTLTLASCKGEDGHEEWYSHGLPHWQTKAKKKSKHFFFLPGPFHLLARAVSSPGSLAFGICHRSVLFAQKSQRACLAAVNATWQVVGFSGKLLEPDGPLGTFLSQVFTGTNASLFYFAPPLANFCASCSVCCSVMILHAYNVSDFYFEFRLKVEKETQNY